jgi:hypothetical protein
MKWIVIEQIESPAKTKRWKVATTYDATILGRIAFYPRWRKYAFYPETNTLYEQDCLRDIAEFLETETKAWRAGLKKSVNQRSNEER